MGIYVDSKEFSAAMEHGADGILVLMEQHAWVDNILRLVQDDQLRHTLLHNTKLKIRQLAALADDSYQDLLYKDND